MRLIIIYLKRNNAHITKSLATWFYVSKKEDVQKRMLELIEELINISIDLLKIIKKQNEIIEQNKLINDLSKEEQNSILKAERLIDDRSFLI